MEELHTDSIDGGSEAIYRPGHVPGWGRTPTDVKIVMRIYIIENNNAPSAREWIAVKQKVFYNSFIKIFGIEIPLLSHVTG